MNSSFESVCSEVERIRQNQGDSKRSPRIPRRLQQKALGFLKQGMCASEICQGLHISEKTFSYWRHRNRLSMEGRSGFFREVALSSLATGLRLRTPKGHEILGLNMSDLEHLLTAGVI